MILTIVTFFAVLGILVLVHEFGHFMTARKFGVKVEEFGLGLPPRMFGFFKNDQNRWQAVGLKAKSAVVPKTLWSLNWIPLGGFVKIKGEEGGDTTDVTSFVSKPVWQRIVIISAGVSMNVVLAVVLFSIGLAIGSPQVVETAKISPLARVTDIQVRVAEVLPGSPAEAAGLKVADSVVRVDTKPIDSIDQLQALVAAQVGTTVTLVVNRTGQEITTAVTPRVLAETGKPGIGVALVQTGFVSYPWYAAPWFAVIEVGKMIGAIVVGFFIIIKTLLISGKLVGQVYGPVGIAGLVGDAARLGFLYLMQFRELIYEIYEIYV